MCPTYKILYQRIPIAVDVNTCNLNSSLQTPSQCFVQLLRTIQRNRMKSKYGVPFPFYVPRHCLRVVITTLCRLTVHENVIQNVGSVCIFSFKVITRGSQNSHSEVPKNRPWTNPPTPMKKKCLDSRMYLLSRCLCRRPGAPGPAGPSLVGSCGSPTPGARSPSPPCPPPGSCSCWTPV